MANTSIFFRVHHPQGLGLWYNKDGEFTNKVIDLELGSACLDMSHDKECDGGYLSCVETMQALLNWFTREELERLTANGYNIVIFESSSYKVCNKYGHHLIEAATAKQIGVITLI